MVGRGGHGKGAEALPFGIMLASCGGVGRRAGVLIQALP